MYKHLKTKRHRNHNLVGGWIYETSKKLDSNSETINSGSRSGSTSSRSKSKSRSTRKHRNKHKRVKAYGLKTKNRRK